MPKFNIGDKVRLTYPNHSHNGQEGIVNTQQASHVTYKLTKQGGGLDEAYDRGNIIGTFTAAHQNNLELVESEPGLTLTTIKEPAMCGNGNALTPLEQGFKDGMTLSGGSAVNHPSHYNQGKIEVIDAIEDWGLGFNDGNAIKYIARAKHKGKRKEDLEKALWFIRRELGYLD